MTTDATTDHATEIAAAEARLAAAQDDVDRLTAPLAAEQSAAPSGPRLATWEDGVAAAQKRFPGKTRSELAKAAGNGDAQGTPTLR